MIKSLYISQYALISQLQVSFEPGFTVITGETGAGKSIILGALSLILGQRADSKVIHTGADKCIVEAEFEISGYEHLKTIFEDNDLDNDGKWCIIRREVSSKGKSRAFINDTPVSLNVLKDLSEQLIDIHSQHENLLITHPHFQLEVLDTVAGNKIPLKSYQEKFRIWNESKKTLQELEEKAADYARDQEYIQFQFQQLEDARLISGELESLEGELATLEHAGEIQSELGQSVDLLQGDEGVLHKLKSVHSSLSRILTYLPEGDDKLQRLDSSYIDLKDIVEDLDSILGSVESDPARQELVEERLSDLYSLMKKFRTDNVDQLLLIKQDFEDKLNDILSFDDQIQGLKDTLKLAQQEMDSASEELSKNRKKSIHAIINHIEDLLHKLGMPNARLDIQIEKIEYNNYGQDSVKFLFSANKNHPMQAIQQIASGGEISRLMLAVKSLIADRSDLPTIILDEIDTGISGEIAHQMGEIMKQMSSDMQVMAITHLPQIAAMGNSHLKVYKEDLNDGTQTSLLLLNKKERESEIASMIGGNQAGEHALTLAREMLSR